jgi:hypothetical protein
MSNVRLSRFDLFAIRHFVLGSSLFFLAAFDLFAGEESRR